jgi:hypothetical protein
MTIKVGDHVALTRKHLWAPKGAVGVVNTIHTEWDPDDTICWDLEAFFSKDQLSGSLKHMKWFGKDAGLHFDSVEPILGLCMKCHKAVFPDETFDIGSRRSAILYWHRKDENGECITR